MRSDEKILSAAKNALDGGLTLADVNETAIVADREEDRAYWRKVHAKMLEIIAEPAPAAPISELDRWRAAQQP